MIVKYSFYVIVLLVVFSACKNNEQNDAILSSVNQSLESSAKNLDHSTLTIYKDLEEKLYDPTEAEVAKIWQPRALEIQSISRKIFNDIDSLKIDLQKKKRLEENKANELYKKLKKYKQDLMAIAPEINAKFNQSQQSILKTFDIADYNEADFYNSYFKNNSALSVLTILNSFQNNVKIVENQTTTFCYYQIGHVDGKGFFTKFSTIVGQSTNHLRTGDVLEISAGIGEYSIQSQPKIKINGKDVECIDGRANYKIKASEKIGKHFVPVKIEFTDQNGVKQISTSKIEYLVDE